MLFTGKRFIRYFDWISFSFIVMISAISLLFVFSATYKPGEALSIFFKKQLIGVLSGLLIYFFCSFLDYRAICRTGYFLYFFSIGLLIFTMVKGTIGMGAQRWINLGLFKFQPSELSKLFFPMFLTYYFLNDSQVTKPPQRAFIIPLIIMLVSAALILKQPDLGTSLILIFSGSVILWLIGLSNNFFIVVGLLTMVTAPISWRIMLKPYQKRRIQVFLGYGELQKERYQIEQSKIAIGSGGFWGKGFLQGTQNKLSFLPESRTDFIFSVICEEIGLAGASFVLLLFLLLFARIFLMINSLTTFYPQLLCVGLIIHIIFSTIINICMVLDLLPIVGIPLPFVSYGITHLWIGFASLGCINSITSQRYVHDL